MVPDKRGARMIDLLIAGAVGYIAGSFVTMGIIAIMGGLFHEDD